MDEGEFPVKTSRAARGLVAAGLGLSLFGGGVAGAGEAGRTVAEEARDKRPIREHNDGSSRDSLSRALSTGRIGRAEYALERATSLFTIGKVRERFGSVDRPDPHSATGLLRDLALRKDELSRTDRRRANAILARPTDGNADPQGDGWGNFGFSSDCNTNLDAQPDQDVCIHYITDTSSEDAATPSFAGQAMTEVGNVWAKEIDDLGYRRPQSDENSSNIDSGDALDIYLADIGDDGVYGYCTTDEPGARNKKTVSAYCVVDNDYDPAQYDAPPPEVNGTNALRVTLAHELFHAIQFNYDWREARFLMEGTAVWMENQVFDNIDASYAYLFDSALHQPEIPLDAFQGDDDENFEYGAFIFFTWLSEAIDPAFPGEDPSIVKKIWVKAGGTKKGIGAVEAAVNAEGYDGPSTPFRDFFAEWGAANYWYDAYYEEGYVAPANCTFQANSLWDSLRCLRPPTDAQFILGGPGSKTGQRSLQLDRRSNRYVELYPANFGPDDIKVTVDLPDKVRGGEATVLVLPDSFIPYTRRIKLNAAGNGSRKITVGGSSEANDTVHLVLSNTGSRNNETYKYKAEVLAP